jgi:hypothetical protein
MGIGEPDTREGIGLEEACSPAGVVEDETSGVSDSEGGIGMGCCEDCDLDVGVGVGGFDGMV